VDSTFFKVVESEFDMPESIRRSDSPKQPADGLTQSTNDPGQIDLVDQY
jgi:hypothetical protein